MSKKQVDNKKEISAEALRKIINEQDSKIMALSRETERVKRNSRIMLISCIIMVFIVVGVVSATAFWKPAKPTWHEVARFSGTFHEFESKDTDSFNISSDHWRLHWTVNTETPPPEDVELRLFLKSSARHYPALVWLKSADFSPSVGDDMLWGGYKEGTEYGTGSGEFYLRLLGASLKWEIIVEAYY